MGEVPWCSGFGWSGIVQKIFLRGVHVGGVLAPKAGPLGLRTYIRLNASGAAVVYMGTILLDVLSIVVHVCQV